jgi:hypothetical protein
MTREERCQLAIERGFIYDSETGDIISPKGIKISRKEATGYIVFKLKVNKKDYCLKGHQFAWYCVNKECVTCIDHINGVRDDNRICNLRSVTKQENAFNNKSKGYSWNKESNKYRAKISLNKKTIHLGYFDSEEEARQAYIKAKERFHNYGDSK